MAKHHILFVSHDATRSGAPIELLHFLRWFKRNSDRPFSVLLGRGGELVADFEKLADTWSIDRSCWRRDALRTRLLFAAGFGAWARRAEATDAQRFAARCPPLWFIQTPSRAARLSFNRASCIPWAVRLIRCLLNFLQERDVLECPLLADVVERSSSNLDP